MDYVEQIGTARKQREDLINQYRHENHQKDQIFEYFPIEPKWKISVMITHRTPKGIVKDYEIPYQLIGKVDFKIELLKTKADLYQIVNENEKYYLGL